MLCKKQLPGNFPRTGLAVLVFSGDPWNSHWVYEAGKICERIELVDMVRRLMLHFFWVPNIIDRKNELTSMGPIFPDISDPGSTLMSIMQGGQSTNLISLLNWE